MIELTGAEFFSAVEKAFSKVSLTNSDGYPVPVYQFIDTTDAAESHGEVLAKSLFVMMDGYNGQMLLAPIVDDGKSAFGNASERLWVFSDDVQKVH